MAEIKNLSMYHNFPNSKYCYFCNGENDIEEIGFEVQYIDGTTEKVCGVCLYEYSLSYNAKYIKKIINLQYKE